jgi:hypothetical protein
MAQDSTSLRSRRAVIGAAVGAAAATVATGLLPRQSAEAANGDNLILGQANAATSPTHLTANPGDNILPVLGITASYGSAIQAENSDTISGQAIQAQGPAGGVHAMATAIGYPGVVAVGDPGLLAQGAVGAGSGVAGVALLVGGPSILGAHTGVYGESNDAIGVHGVGGAGATGAVGQSTETGTGVQGYSGGQLLAAAPPAAAGTGVEGIGPSPGRGVHGFSGAGTPPAAPAAPIGVYGEAVGTNATGVWGYSATVNETGVYGEGATGVWGFGGWGVFGASNATGTGVYGFSGASVPGAPAHTGVFGYSDSGVGVYARAATGTALYVNGKAGFSRSGRVAITAGHSSISKSLAGVTTSSLIIAVMQTYRAGFYLVAAVPAAGKFTVYLNRTVPGTTYVAFFVVN